MKIARVFPRKTAASPDDDLAFLGPPPMLILPEIDEVHISVTFTWDMQIAEWLYDQWSVLGVPVTMGGPDVCPNCGASVVMTREELKNIKEIRLEEIKQERRERAVETVKDKDVKELRTLQEFQAYAKQHNYKSGWAFMAWKARRGK